VKKVVDIHQKVWYDEFAKDFKKAFNLSTCCYGGIL